MSTLHLTPDTRLRILDGGRTLLGGSPLRVLRVSQAGASLAQRWLNGAPVPEHGPARQLAQRLVRSGMAHPQYTTAHLRPADVTIIIPVRDQAEGAAALRRAMPDVAEVVLIDDGSAEPVPGAAIRHKTARGPSAARNMGWRRAGTPLVAFLDADTLPEPGWLENLLPCFEDPEVAAAAPRIRSMTGDGVLARYEQAESPLDLGNEPGLVRPGTRISYVPSAALVLRSDALRDIDGFDEALRFGEDVDLVWRLAAAGHQVRYEPRSVVRHAPRAGFKSWARQRFQYGTAAAPLALRHGDAVAPVRISAWSAATWASVCAGRDGLGLTAAAMGTGMLTHSLRRVGVQPGESVRLAAEGHLRAARLLGEAVRRPWAPFAVPALMVTRRGRHLLAVIVAGHLYDWLRRRPALDPLRWTLLRITDDLAYGTGVCWGALRDRSMRPLLPYFTGMHGNNSDASIKEDSQ